jgi:hypothetical protein
MKHVDIVGSQMLDGDYTQHVTNRTLAIENIPHV